MEPIFAGDGRVVGWKRGDVIRDLNGRTVAFIHRATVYSRSGQELCKLSNGYFRYQGDAVAFLQDASSGPMKPMTALRPMQPICDITPIKPIFAVPQVAHVPTRNWSSKPISAVIPGL